MAEKRKAEEHFSIWTEFEEFILNGTEIKTNKYITIQQKLTENDGLAFRLYNHKELLCFKETSLANAVIEAINKYHSSEFIKWLLTLGELDKTEINVVFIIAHKRPFSGIANFIRSKFDNLILLKLLQ